jgi:hypothetical protein
MSNCNIAHFVYNFTSHNSFISANDITTHFIIFMRNPVENKPEHIEIKNVLGETIQQLNIIWNDNYGIVDFQNRYLNMLNPNCYKITCDNLNDNFKVFIRGIMVYVNVRQNLQNQDLFINIMNENIEPKYLQDDHLNFNAIKIANYQSFKLKIFGIERVKMTKTALKAYKEYINNEYFILGLNPIEIHKVNHVFNNKEMELESVIKYQ